MTSGGAERVDVTARLMDLFELVVIEKPDPWGSPGDMMSVSEWRLRSDAPERVAWFRNLASGSWSGGAEKVPEPGAGFGEIGVREIARYVYGVVPEPCGECGRDRVTDAQMTSVRRTMRRLGIT